MKTDILSTNVINSFICENYNCIIKCFDSVGSTNTEAKNAIKDGLAEDALFFARKQTEGRGRHGKSFFSPSGGLYISAVIHLDVSLSDATSVTAAAAVAVCKAIESATKKHPKIKWVNDIFVDGKKVCGILTEAVSDFESGKVNALIVGVGINVDTKGFPEELENIAGALDVKLNKCQLAADIFNRLKEICDKLPDKSFMDDYRKYSLILGKTIYFNRNGVDYTAKALDILDDGSLIALTDDGKEIVLNSGEISIKLN